MNSFGVLYGSFEGGKANRRQQNRYRSWVLGCSSLAVAVEAVHEVTVVRYIPLGARRLHVDAAHPEVPGAEDSGFRAARGQRMTKFECAACRQGYLPYIFASH
jgi:hypothetical protein